MSFDDSLGAARLPLAPLLRRGCNEELTLPLDGKRATGHVRIALAWVDAPEPEAPPPPPPPPPQGPPPLVQWLEAEEWHVRRAAVVSVGKLDAAGVAECAEALLRLVDDADPDVRRTALHVIEERVDPATLAAHADAMLLRLGSPDAGVRGAALAVLARIEPAALAEHTAVLVELLRDPHPHVRRAAVEALTRLDPCLLYTSPSPRDGLLSRMPSSA